MGVLLYFSVVCLHVYAYAFKSKLHCGGALGPGTCGLPYYCAPLVCVPDVIGGRERALTVETVRIEDLGRNGSRSESVSDIVRVD